MANLGEFGSAKREADPDREHDTLTLCGEKFQVADEIDPLALLEFGEAASAGLDGDSPEGMKAMLALIRSAVDETEYSRFRAVVRKNRPSMETLLELAMAVIQRESGRPTVPASGSSAGSSETSESSKALSSSAAPSTRGWRDTPFGRRELAVHPELYEGLGSVAENGRNLSLVQAAV